MVRFGYGTDSPIEEITGSATNYFDPAGGSNETVLSPRHLLCFLFFVA